MEQHYTSTLAMNNFPKDFLWGAASAAYQIEGAYNSHGKGLSIWDEWVKIPGKTFQGTNGDIATDHYHRYEEDVRLMKEQGLKTYRFSFAWTRILPEGTGKVNQEGLDFYHKLIDLLLENDIVPMVTLYHWDLPKRLQDKYGGWLSKEIIKDFSAYAKLVFDEFHTKVKHWIVLNEPNIFTQLGYLLAVHPPGLKDEKLFIQAYHHTALAHAAVVNLYKDGDYEHGMIGSSIAITPGFAASNSEEDLEALRRYNDTHTNWLTDIYYKGTYPEWGYDYFKKMGVQGLEMSLEEQEEQIRGANNSDFIGVNYYQSTTVAHNPIDGVGSAEMNTDGIKRDFIESGVPGLYKSVYNPNVEYTDWNWVVDPNGLTELLVYLDNRYHLPIIISENGLGAFDKVEDGAVHDDYRIDFIRKHIVAINNALEKGVDLRAYCVWSFTDLLSWLNGFQKRYGFVHIDFEDDSLSRLKKDSYYWYQEVINTNGDSVLK